MKKPNTISLLLVWVVMTITGCMSIESMNNSLKPVNEWYEQEYESTRFTQRYKFTKTDIVIARKEVINVLPRIGMTVTSAGNDVVATGNPTTMFTTSECESWKDVDLEKSKQLSGGMLALTCDSSNRNSILVATVSFRQFKSGTLIVLDYELKNPQFESYGLRGPRRPPPAASKAGSSKFWDILSRSLPHPVHNATKEDLK